MTPDEIRKIQSDIKKLTKSTQVSFKWFVDYLKKIRTKSVPLQSRKLNVGEMRLFTYDPKWKKVLPYYDVYPLILVLAIYSDSFLGVNFHYLPPQYRQQILSKLITSANAESSKRMMSEPAGIFYGMKNPLWQAAIKKYLPDHVKSPMYIVPKSEWAYCANLPVQKFEKASQQYVWRMGRMDNPRSHQKS